MRRDAVWYSVVWCGEVRRNAEWRRALSLVVCHRTKIFYFGGLVDSCEIAQRDGAYETFQGSPASEGRLQFDLWDLRDPLHQDPNELKYLWATTLHKKKQFMV